MNPPYQQYDKVQFRGAMLQVCRSVGKVCVGVILSVAWAVAIICWKAFFGNKEYQKALVELAYLLALMYWIIFLLIVLFEYRAMRRRDPVRIDEYVEYLRSAKFPEKVLWFGVFFPVMVPLKLLAFIRLCVQGRAVRKKRKQRVQGLRLVHPS